MDPDTLAACRTLMDRDRLRIVGALAGADATAETLAESLHLPLRSVARHLAQLRFVGLVTTLGDGRDSRALHALARGRLVAIAADIARFEAAQDSSTSDLPGAEVATADGGWTREDANVLHAFVRDGRLTSIPAQHTRRLVVLRFLAATCFLPGELYPEKEVNMRLALRHPDVASLRRYLIDEGLMERSAGVYRLRGSVGEAPQADRGA